MDRDEVRRVAALARLDIPEDRMERMAQELSAVLEYAEALRRLDLTGCEPLVFAPADATLRADGPDGRQLDREAALAAAPEHEDAFFLVPPVVENIAP